jgi:hypothetical protein
VSQKEFQRVKVIENGGWPTRHNNGCPTRRGFRRVGTANLNLLVACNDTPQAHIIRIAAQRRRGYRHPLVENRDEVGRPRLPVD